MLQSYSCYLVMHAAAGAAISVWIDRQAVSRRGRFVGKDRCQKGKMRLNSALISL